MNEKETESLPVVWVTGGSGGLGLATVERFASSSIVVTCSRRESDALRALRSRFGPDQVHWESVDLLDVASMRAFVSRNIQRFGRVDVLINNAGTALDGLLTLSDPSAIERCVALNLTGSLQFTRAVSKAMLAQQSGVIVNISSVTGIRGHKGVAVYSATKAGLDGFTRSLARELGPLGIRVNGVAPGYFQSDMTSELTEVQRARIARRTPLGRLAHVSEVVDVIVYLASPRAGFVTGQILTVDGGLTC